MEKLQICLANNICKFKNDFYQFQDGLPMGSPISPLMGEIFMNRVENEIFSSNSPLLQHVHYWCRYVDDVLCLWHGNTEQLTDFLHFINSSLYPSIKFTLEVGGSSINFLDLTITLANNRHYFEIYRKPTHTDTLIHGLSFHPLPRSHTRCFPSDDTQTSFSSSNLCCFSEGSSNY